MANTLRKTTAFPTPGQENLLGIAVKRCKYNTSKYLERQGRRCILPNLLEAIVPLIAKTAMTAAALHAQWSGSRPVKNQEPHTIPTWRIAP